jgi:hypothetical protein
MIRRQRITAVVAALSIFSLVSCAGKGNPNTPARSPQASVAKYAGDLMASVHVVQTTIAASPAPENIQAAVMGASERIGQVGLKLSDVLKAYDSAVNLLAQSEAARQASALLEQINGLIPLLLQPIQNPQLRDQVGKLVTNVLNIVLTVKGAISGALLPTTPSTAPAIKSPVSWNMGGLYSHA